MQHKKSEPGGVRSSSSVASHKGWLALWSANIPRKVKVHVWRLLKNGLAVGSELQRRRIKGGVVCVACGREETALHCFWQCPHAIQVWNHIRLYARPVAIKPPAHVHNRHYLLNWLLEWVSLVKDSEIDLTMMALYQIWLLRNDARNSHRIED